MRLGTVFPYPAPNRNQSIGSGQLTIGTAPQPSIPNFCIFSIFRGRLVTVVLERGLLWSFITAFLAEAVFL